MNPSRYFHVSDYDKEYYAQHIQSRLPKKILDAHSHMSKPEHVANIPQSRLDSDWALRLGCIMTAPEADDYARVLFPGIDYSFAAFPMPIKEADINANNDYIARLIKKKEIAFGLITTPPEMPADELEKKIIEGNFVGLKPYPDYVSAYKGAEVGMYEFLPESHIAMAEKLGKCIMLHLPRHDRLADEKNISELREILARHPKLKIIIAHLGRCFNPYYFEKALKLLGKDIHRFWFDTSAVMNPHVHTLAMTSLHEDRILFGLDWPVLLWHGTRTWTEKTYHNIIDEPAFDEKLAGKADPGRQYTFFVYEQIRNILDVMDATGKSAAYKQKIFHDNAQEFYSGCLASRQ